MILFDQPTGQTEPPKNFVAQRGHLIDDSGVLPPSPSFRARERHLGEDMAGSLQDAKLHNVSAVRNGCRHLALGEPTQQIR